MPTKKGTKKTPKKVVAQEVKFEKDSKSSKKSKEEVLNLVSSNTIKNIPKTKGLAILALLLIIALGYLAFKWLVVAWVDGKPVTLIEVRNQLSKGAGNSFRDQLIAEKLIEGEATKRNISLSNDELASEIKKLEDEQGGKEALQQQLAMNGSDEETFKKQYRIRLLLQKIFSEEASVSGEEVDKFIEENKASLVDATDTAKLKKDVREQIKQTKLEQIISTWIQEALKGSRVTRT